MRHRQNVFKLKDITAFEKYILKFQPICAIAFVE